MQSNEIILNLLNLNRLKYARYLFLMTSQVEAITNASEKMLTAPKLLEESNLTQSGMLRLMKADHQKVVRSLEALKQAMVPYGYKTKHDQLVRYLSEISFNLGLIAQLISDLNTTFLPKVLESLLRDFNNMKDIFEQLVETLNTKARKELLREGIEI
ncbi:hypothetical protein YSY43_15810 [Paenibacillus sp. YSY-4.3]